MIVPRPLRNRILLAVSAVTLGVSLVFSLYTVVFIYAVEDAFLNAQIKEEAAYQYSHRAMHGDWAAPRDPKITLHRSKTTLPVEISVPLREEAERIEFPGTDGSHFHLLGLSATDGASAWLVYDAGQRLVVQPMRNSILWLLACTTIVFVLISLVAGYWASRRTTRRLEGLAAAVVRIDPNQLPAPLVDEVGDDEVGVVARGLGEMTQRLRDFVERERRFTRDASHELRTPLSVIRSAGDQLAGQPELGDLSRRHAALIQESTARLEQTVSTLLELARESYLVPGNMDVPLLPLIEQTVIEQSPRLEGKSVNVLVRVPASASLQAPRAVTRILLANLVGNAFAHTVSGTVRIDTDDGVFRISNTLARSEHAHDEEPAGGPPVPAGDSFGFGLSIVQRLCDKFGLEFRLRVVGDTVVATISLAPDRQALGLPV